MPRATDDDVRAILEIDATVAPSLTVYIRPANMLVDEVCLPVTTYSETRLKEIEIWLAAHFYRVSQSKLVQESVGGVITTTAQHVEDLGFDATEYGQMAMRLDTAGGLAKINAQSKAKADTSFGGLVGAWWLGTNEKREDSPSLW